MKAVIGRKDIPGLVISGIIGLALTLLGSVKLKNAAETNSWPLTNGTVTSSEVAGTMTYYPTVSYTYIVDSAVYTSSTISNMNFNTKNRSVAEEVVNKYPLDAEINVYYSSTDPSKALLEPGVNTGNILLLAFGLIVLAVPVISVLFMKFEVRKVPEKQ
jgi:hypothetical protein